VLNTACSQPTELSRFQFTPNDNGAHDGAANPHGYRVLHHFGAGHDGSRPNGVITVGDTFYGTTAGGGTKHCGGNYGGCGTVFSITADGTEKVLHNFGEGKDGRNPVAGLVVAHGVLYGTTAYGGAHGNGTVFSITLSGKEKVLYSFGAEPDGGNPTGRPIDVDGTLYGTTFAGGIGCGHEGCGTVFSVTMDGKERVLHRFDDVTNTDGWYPDAGLTEVGSTLYGTTYQGGLYGWGTVFSISKDGKEKLLHSFGKGNDGWYPAADLHDVEGTLYGTTVGGGSHNCSQGYGGCGTVFSIATDGKERVLHSFNGVDGSFPASSLIDVSGILYGSTQGGGPNSCGPYGHCGTVFSITRGGTENVLHSFGERYGYRPMAHLRYKSGRLFGTTELGGPYDGGSLYGGGAFFSLTP
jgi:uncharacterized repeat protein (TIGR03803 family)